MNRKTQNVLLPLVFLMFILILWQFTGKLINVAFWALPLPWDIVKVLFEFPGLIWSHLWPTMIESVLGLLISVLFGVLVALLMHFSRFVKTILYPYIVVSQTVPIIAVAPLIILWFGYGISAKIFVVVLVCFFPISLGLYDGLRQVSMEQIRLLRSMGAGNWKVFRLLMIPASLPSLFTGLKLAATYSVLGAVIGEWLGGNAGLGIYLTRATKSFRTEHVFAAIIVVVALSLFLFGFVTLLERVMLSWHFRKIEQYEDVSSARH